jgi:hypothetical protein
MKGEKTGGRSKGVPNKITQTARELFASTLEQQVPNLLEAFESVRESDPAKFLELFAKYAQYFVPKQVDVTTNGEQVKQVFKIGNVEVEL